MMNTHHKAPDHVIFLSFFVMLSISLFILRFGLFCPAGRIILKCILQKYCVNWIHSSQETCRAVGSSSNNAFCHEVRHRLLWTICNRGQFTELHVGCEFRLQWEVRLRQAQVKAHGLPDRDSVAEGTRSHPRATSVFISKGLKCGVMQYSRNEGNHTGDNNANTAVLWTCRKNGKRKVRCWMNKAVADIIRANYKTLKEQVKT
jgi:hypothetical protein